MNRFKWLLLLGALLGIAPLAIAKPARKTKPAQPKVTLQWPRFSRANGGDKATGNPMLQLLLRHRGFYKSEIDEMFGPKTEAAVKAFQKQAGLKADGLVGPQTWQKLIVRVKRGDKGDAVKAVQYLFDYAYSEVGDERDNLTSDGKGFFGPKTDKAVRILQIESDLTPDGVVGLQTWCVLLGGKAISGKVMKR